MNRWGMNGGMLISERRTEERKKWTERERKIERKKGTEEHISTTTTTK